MTYSRCFLVHPLTMDSIAILEAKTSLSSNCQDLQDEPILCNRPHDMVSYLDQAYNCRWNTYACYVEGAPRGAVLHAYVPSLEHKHSS